MPPPLPPDHVVLTTRAAWRAWLAANHERGAGVWAVRYKKGASRPSLSTDDLVEEAIAWGWIDSTPRKVDDERFAVRVAPRKPGSNWSALSKRRAARAETDGAMTAAGRAAIARAEADGTWTILDDVERLVVPDDLAAALAAAPPARDEWDAFPPSTRRGILEWILNAKRDPTRAKRVAETARLAREGRRANQWPREEGA